MGIREVEARPSTTALLMVPSACPPCYLRWLPSNRATWPGTPLPVRMWGRVAPRWVSAPERNLRCRYTSGGIVLGPARPCQRYRQELWIDRNHAAAFSSLFASTNPLFTNLAPALTKATP